MLFSGLAMAQSGDLGRTQFQTRCVGCHGEDGQGAGRGPNIVNVELPRAATRDAVRDVIRYGIPGRGMPAFSMPDAELDAIAGHVMSLRSAGAGSATGAQGDAVAGE